MSWFTVFARTVGLGGVLDAVEAAEKIPSPATISSAVTSVVTAIPAAANIAITDVGTMVGAVVVGAATKLNPAAGKIAANIVAPMLAEMEQVAEKWLAAETAGAA
jgi:hypothetical protein